MKLKEIDQKVFQKYKDINFDVSLLYFDYGNKEIYDLLKQVVSDPQFLYERIKVKPANEKIHNDLHDFLYLKHKEVTDSQYHFYFTLINLLPEDQKQNLLDLSLEKADKRFASILLKNPEIKLTQQQFNTIFEGSDPHNKKLKVTLIENPNIPLSVEQINDGLVNWDFGMNTIYAKRRDSCILKRTIDTLINETNAEPHDNEDVLVELLKNHKIHFDEIQVNHFLNSNNFMLRAECARNYNLSFTQQQIAQGLEDTGFEYEGYDDTYEDYHPTDVVRAFLSNPNITIPYQKVNELAFGLDKENFLELLVERKDLKLNSQQVDAILEKNNKSSILLLENENIFLNDNQILKAVYSSKYWPKYIAEIYLARDNVKVSETVMNVLKILPSEEMKKVLQEKGHKLLLPNEENVIKKSKTKIK